MRATAKTVRETLEELGYGRLYAEATAPLRPEPRCEFCKDEHEDELLANGGCAVCGAFAGAVKGSE